MLNTLTDDQLLTAIRAGDQQAFAALVERHVDHLWAVAITTLTNHDDAADAVQDSLMRIYRNLPSFRGESALITWMHRIVVNVCLDRLRQRASQPNVPLVIDVMNTQDPISAAEHRIDIASALAQLPFDQRSAVVLVDLHGMPIKDASELLSVPEGTVKSRCFRGRMALARILAPMMNGSTSAPVHATPNGGASR